MVLPIDCGVDVPVWLDDPLGEAWWDPADEGVEPGFEVDGEVESLLASAGVGVVCWAEVAGVGTARAAEAAPAPASMAWLNRPGFGS